MLTAGVLSAQSQPASPAAVLFPLEDVRLLDGPFRTAQELDRQYLLALDSERLLLMFNVTAGRASWAKPLGGWESPGVEIRGQTLGHYLSAASLMVASTGDPELKRRVDHLVAVLAECQAALPSQGYHPGYLSAFPESLFDRLDARQPVWVPWYTMHKVMAGLYEAHVHAGNAQALEVLTRLADWVKFRVDRLSEAQMQASLRTEHGGMNEVLANLYAITRNPDHLRLSEAFNHHAVLDPLAAGIDDLDSLHANTQIPKITGVARQYELTGEPRDRAIASFFWRSVALDRSFAMGGHSDNEHFFPKADMGKHLGPFTAETCNTYNMLKLTEHLFSWEPSAPYMDFYERALYNQILASQDPRTGMVAYFISTKPGHFKTYSTPENSFWCCVGTGMENHAKYAEAIYAREDDAVMVNLFVASELTWRDRGLVLRQDTRFPVEGSSRLTLSLTKPARFTLKIRQPAWAPGPLALRVNDKPVEAKLGEDGYLPLSRDWKDGDIVSLALPTPLRTETLGGDPHTVAVFAGPILLAGALGTDGMPPAGAYAEHEKDFAAWPTPAVPTLSGDPTGILAGIEPVAGRPLTFQTHGLGHPKDVTLVPFYGLHHERYTLYWSVQPLAEATPH